MSYSLTSGDTNAFSIDSKTGIITSKVQFDRETKDAYTLTVRATDHGKNPLDDTTKVDITILDINDNKPDIQNLPQTVRVSEKWPAGYNVVGVSANDKDTG